MDLKPFKTGDVAICAIPTSTTSKDIEYHVRGCFCYKKRGLIHCFITIKNDFGYTVKINANKFNKK